MEARITTGVSDRSSGLDAPIETRLAAAGLPLPPRLAWLEIDLSTLATNARSIRGYLPEGTQIGIVVKADGYGHGLVAAAHAALLGGADVLIVATLDEGLRLRGAAFAAPILILYPVPPWAVETALRARLDLVALDPGSVEALVRGLKRLRDASGSRSSVPVRIHLGIDTGMARGGFSPAHAVDGAQSLLAGGMERLAGVWSHLASPEDVRSVQEQVRLFEVALDNLSAAGLTAGTRHLAATGGVLGGACPAYDMARLGLAFYGHIPPEFRRRTGAPHPVLSSALSLKARASAVASVSAGTTVGYGGDWATSRESVIAVLPVGYADGWTRLYSPGSHALIGGRRVPLVGRVGSDALAVDVTDIPNFDGDVEVILLGNGGNSTIDVDELAQRRGSISWEVLDSWTTRLPRVYFLDGAPVAVRYLDGDTVLKSGLELPLGAGPSAGR